MAHTLIYCHVRPFAHTEPFPHKKKNTNTKKRESFQVSPFRTLHILSVFADLFRVEMEQEIQKKEQRLGFGGLQGVKFKFVIPHVQVNIKMLQLVQLSCQQDRFRAGRVPPVVC